MADFATDKKCLTEELYATDELLAIRIRTHELYTRPQIDFPGWVLSHIPWRGDEIVLDVGCGAGIYIEPVLARVKVGRLISADLSMGMLGDVADKKLKGQRDMSARIVLLNADMISLPLPDAYCDVVLANHMLYHVPDIEQAVAEAWRVLRTGGYFIAATNGRDSMQILRDEFARACWALDHPVEVPARFFAARFSLENGRDYIAPHFPEVKQAIFESYLVFPEAKPALDYLRSMCSMWHLYAAQLPPSITWETVLEQIIRQIEAHIARHGEFRVSKTSGVFVGIKEG
jgi:ubiquinone/menaquinone biosynthesis C-methylase UbiE